MNDKSLEVFQLRGLDKTQFINIIEILYLFMISDGDIDKKEVNFLTNLLLINDYTDLNIWSILSNLNNKLENYNVMEYFQEVARNLLFLWTEDKAKIILSIKTMIHADGNIANQEENLLWILLVIWWINNF